MPDDKQSDYPDTPRGWSDRWQFEMKSAKKSLEKWHNRGEKIVNRFLDNRTGSSNEGDTRLNLFTSNIQTIGALIYGKTPTVAVQRRFADSQDDQARVAAEMLERLLNMDIDTDGDGFKDSLRHALEDRLLAGLGNCRIRYEADFETMPEIPAIMHPTMGHQLAPPVPAQDVKTEENVCVDYIYWKDQLWSPCRTFNEVRWWAFKAEMTREQLIERFGEAGKNVPLNSKRSSSTDMSEQKNDPWSRADVWEVWDKEHKKVFWVVDGHDHTLDQKDDPLGLEGFWPFPCPMFSNLTTSKLVPTPDYVIAQDIYEQCDNLATRIRLLEDALRVAGVYDKTNDGVKRLVSDTKMNELIGVDSWALFAERGGVKGAVDWLPIENIANVLQILQERLTANIALLFQITGMSDIMRGQASQNTTATEQAIKARFASVRVQYLQDEFARFASDVQKIKAEVISKHFSEQTIIDRSNIMRTPDAQLAPQGVQLIKSNLYEYRVSVNPDSVSLTDFAALQKERFDFLQALSGFFQQSVPIVQALGPSSLPFLLQIAQWSLAGLKGASEIEGVFDQAVAALKQQQIQAQLNPPPPPPPDPKVIAAQVKSGAEQFKAKADVMKTGLDMQRAKEEHAMEMQRMAVEHQTTLAQEEGKQRTDALRTVNELVKNASDASTKE
jgi:hypothetical protein